MFFAMKPEVSILDGSFKGFLKSAHKLVMATDEALHYKPGGTWAAVFKGVV